MFWAYPAAAEQITRQDTQLSREGDEEPLGFDSELTSGSEVPGEELNLQEISSSIDVKPSITLSPEDERMVIADPSAEDLEKILAAAYDAKGEFLEKMSDYIVGIPGQDRLMSLAEAYREKIFSERGAGAILQKVSNFREGETATLALKFGQQGDEEIVIGRFPRSLIPYHQASDMYYPGDPSLAPLTKWLEILGHLMWVNPLIKGSGAALKKQSSSGFDYKLPTLAAGLIFNYFQQPEQRNFFGGATINPMMAGGTVGMGTADQSHALWFNMMSGYAALGYSGLYNIEENQMGLSAVGAGAFVGGWKNYVTAGVSLSVVMENGNQLGLGGVIRLLKDRVTSYLHRYWGEYDKVLDEFIAEYKKTAIFYLNELQLTERLIVLHQRIHNVSRVDKMQEEKKSLEISLNKILIAIWRFKQEKEYLSDKHFIQVVDSQHKAFRLQGGVYANGVGVGLRAGLSKGSDSIHRFYAPLNRAQELLKDGNGDKLALLRIHKKFDTEQFPDILKPHLWKIGEEVITTVQSTYHGSIVMGLYAIPGVDAKVGISGTVSGSFEIGIRKLPGNKIEVTFCPTKIKELGAFVSTISTIAELSAAASVAVAMRQTFIFDLDNQQAIDTYMLFMTAGVLPLDFSSTANISGQVEAENLLDIAIIARKNLSKKGILLTYLEKIDVPAKKFYAGFARFPLINRHHWAGLTYEYLKGSAKVISTNAEFAVSRTTSHIETAHGKGRNGTRRYGAYATIKRVFVKEAMAGDKNPEEEQRNGSLSDGYTWRFKGITLQVRIDADKVIGHEHNEIIEKINTMFHANVNRFPPDSKGHKQTRDILLERELTGKDLDNFSRVKQSQIEQAANASGLSKGLLSTLLARLEDRGHNEMANVIKEFVGTHGMEGISALHILLEGSCRNLVIRTESDTYVDPVKKAIALEASYTSTDAGEKHILAITADTPAGKISEFFKEIKEAIAAIDQALKDLWEDPLFEGEDDLLKFEGSKLREKKCGIRSKLLAAKNRLLELIDLEKQAYSASAIERIYGAIDKDYRNVFQEYVVLEAKYRQGISMQDSRDEIVARWKKVHALLARIDSESMLIATSVQRKILGQVFVLARIHALEMLRGKAEELISLRHLGSQAQEFVEKMRHKSFFLLPVKGVNLEVADKMEALRKG